MVPQQMTTNKYQFTNTKINKELKATLADFDQCVHLSQIFIRINSYANTICIHSLQSFRLAHFHGHHMHTDRQKKNCLTEVHFVFHFLQTPQRRTACSFSLPLHPRFHLLFVCFLQFWSVHETADFESCFIIVYRRSTLRVSDMLLAVVIFFFVLFFSSSSFAMRLCAMHFHAAFSEWRKLFLLFTFTNELEKEAARSRWTCTHQPFISPSFNNTTVMRKILIEDDE